MTIFRNRPTGALILIMIALVIIGYIIARQYYRSVNSKVDPRIVRARELYARYDSYALEGNYHKIFNLLDSVEAVYDSYPHYKNSFEKGVLYNNRAAALITISLFRDSIRADYNPLLNTLPDSIMNMAESNIKQAISIYNNWLDKYDNKSRENIVELIDTEFRKEMITGDQDLINKYLDARAGEIITSVEETDRRLSVCYTNLGVIERHRSKYEEAVWCYEKALDLWDRNLSAENNLNTLLGRPLKKRNIIQRLFPPEK